MSEQKRFGRRRRGGMHFRPSGGGQPKPEKHHEREAQQARAAAVGDTSPAAAEPLFERSRYQKEIERAENVAAGLPPEGAPVAPASQPEAQKGDFRQPHLDTPAEVKEEYAPVHVQDAKPKGLLDAIKSTATTSVGRSRC